ncbi:MAG: esterase-like activity of phytase family protein [Saprospiraceae bacterium]|nr:esterase-like activity of phytase family protein [Saprospiraceae bacterium]
MIRKLTLLFSLTISTICLLAQDEMIHLASYATGGEGSAETVAYDNSSSRAFFTSTANNSFSIVDISNPNEPTLYKEVSLAEYGAGPNSVAVSNGIVALAVENEDKTANGRVVFFNTEGEYQADVEVGALPDMLTFTPDGSKVLVANEGEPNDDYDVDPPGSVSIIDVAMAMTGAQAVVNISFESYNDKKASLLNKGVRIFGADGMATVAQDMEPEYITITADGSRAYVNCQENNALAVIDLSSNTILDILPLGYKDHSQGSPTLTNYILNELVSDWPELGTPAYGGGQPPVMLGGFSALYFDATESTDEEYVFYTVPDRGPNADAVSSASVTPQAPENLRPFKLPDYQARIVKITLNKNSGAVQLSDQILLFRQDGTTPISGRGNIPGVDEIPVTYADASTEYLNQDFTDPDGNSFHQLEYDAFGGDFEGIVRDKNGNFWLCDENRPAIYQIAPDGTLMERYVPEGTAALGNDPQEEGFYGAETLPGYYTTRRANRGFEAIAYDSAKNIVYAFIQSPLENPGSAVRNNTDVIRILGINADDGVPAEEYVYLLEQNKDSGYSTSRVDKIGDAFYTGDGQFLVIERDSEAPTVPVGKKYIFKIDITKATNVLNLDVSERLQTGPVDPRFGITLSGVNNTFRSASSTLEEMSADEIRALGILPVYKTKVVNLPSIYYQSSDKPEGVSLLPDGTIAVLNDNDFGLAGAGVTDNSILGLISFGNNYSLDASDRDDAINIQNWPTLGMYLPDAIGSYSVNGQDYIVTANEGDSRDYDGYSEEERVKDLILDETYYPDAAGLQEDEMLGRLKTTSSMGDYDQDGMVEQIYSYGARSFSIFDAYGNLVFDSGNEFALTVQTEEEALFNEDEGEKDGRSDDKGVEPEAIEIATINDFTYAFVGLERQSGIIVYDITDPVSPKFITYYNNRMYDGGVTGDIAPEIIKFIPGEDSPNGEPLLLVGYEVSGSMGIIQLGGSITPVSEVAHESRFNVYPNPVTGGGDLNFDIPVSGQVYDMAGLIVKEFDRQHRMNVSDLQPGIYVIRTLEHGAQRFLKLD